MSPVTNEGGKRKERAARLRLEQGRSSGAGAKRRARKTRANMRTLLDLVGAEQPQELQIPLRQRLSEAMHNLIRRDE